MTYFGGLGTATVAVTFWLSGLLHAAHFRGFRRELQEQRILPLRIQTAAALGITTVELALGAGFSWKLLSEPPGLWRVAILGAALALLSLFGLYLVILLRRRPGAPCGCGIGSGAVSPWHLFRNILLVTAVGLSSLQPKALWSSLDGADRLILLMSVAAFTAAMHLLPQAMVDPHSVQQRRSIDRGGSFA